MWSEAGVWAPELMGPSAERGPRVHFLQSPLHSADPVALCVSRETLRYRCLSVKERKP